MKKHVVVLLTLLISLTAVAKPVSERDARRVAYHFLVNQIGVSEQELVMVYSQKLPNAGHAAFYTFAAPHGGFAIVAGDDVALPILAYSYENLFQAEVPDHVASFLADLAGAIDAALTQDVLASHSTRQQWTSLQETIPPLNDVEGTVGPLLTTRWMQYSPYNNMCPMDSVGRVKVGCVAIALGQIIRYWQWPAHPQGWHTYLPSREIFGAQTVDFESEAYDYSLMPNALTTSSANDVISETSKFLYHCGVSVDMNYASEGLGSGSGANVNNVVSAFINHFGYIPSLGRANKNSFDDAEWDSMLRVEIDQQRPVFYNGHTGLGAIGHAWVCDGYNTSGYFHFNMGHGGDDDGWFLVSPIDSAAFYYTSSQNAILGIYPDTNRTSRVVVSHTKGTSRYVVKDTLDVYHVSDLNTLNGYMYNRAYSENTFIFVPEDTTMQLQIELIGDNEGDRYEIYGDAGGSVLLNPDAQYFPIVSTSGVLKITDSIPWLSTYSTYAFRVMLANNCGKIANLKKQLSGDTVYLQWQDNNPTNHWIIEYGPTGFTRGNGSIVTTNDTIVAFPTISPYDAYDFYVRRFCEEHDTHSVWVKYSDKDKKWTDIITAQPIGFNYDTNGNITISSREGLVWLASVVNGLNGQRPHGLYHKKVTLLVDVNLAPYEWTPINDFWGTFDGNNHYIDNLKIIQDNHNDRGFFGRITGGGETSIINTHLTNVLIIGNTRVGALCGQIQNGSINNCSVTGEIFSNGTVGGLIGFFQAGNSLKNCSAKVTINASEVAGGLVGHITSSLVGGKIENCFAQSTITGTGYIGGLVGNLAYSSPSIENCYASSMINIMEATSDSRYGSFVGSSTNAGSIGNCYAKQDEFAMFGHTTNTIIYDTATFVGNSGLLNNSITIGNSQYAVLLSVLNAWVQNQNDTNLLTWVVGDDGLPQFGGRYELPHYTISVLSANPTMGITYGSGTYVEGAEVSISAVPNNGYHFSYWNDGNTENPRVVTVAGDTTYVATFELNPPDVIFYTVSAISNNDAYGTVLGGGTWEAGAEVTLTAVPNDGYHFVGWQDGNADNPRTVIVTADATYVATFEADAPDEVFYTLTVTSTDPSMGSVLGGGMYEAGAEATLTATPNEGYRFVGWQDGNADNPRTVTVTADATYIATFEAEVGIGEVEGTDDIVLYPNPASGQVSLRDVEPGTVVTVVDMQGRIHSKISTQKSEITLDVSQWPAGAYFVRIAGERQAAVRRLLVR